MSGTGRRSGDWVLRAGEVVGDLGNPFYAEERQRDVWNEAAAVGLQLTLWMTLLVATGAVWVAGAPAVPYALLSLAGLGVASAVSVAYAHRLGVRVPGSDHLLRPRMLPYLLVIALLVAGVWRAAPDHGFASGFATGVGIGTVAAALALVIAALRSRRREALGRHG